MTGYPKWFSANLITLVVIIGFATGLLLVPTTLDLRLEMDVPWRLNVDTRVWVVAFHALFGFLFTAILGALWSLHMRVGWRKGINRKSGVGVVALSFALILTGVGIYYVSHEGLVVGVSLGHAAIGVALLPFYLFHLFYKPRYSASK